ncbi:hypothetical protein IRZ83_13395 [Flavobacterium sp. JLP]|uniref:hypothetical protein n=1 Tax=Flavobacterium sp. JLP TaxID=2783793 RepID=UPI00188A3A32|nr:hypothetical protein [Flavobacterium sp. JLP]MBF4507665.1 hypothetical protein [Flavobacterium sp. JLP]
MKKTVLLISIFNLIISCQEPKDTDNCHYKIKFKNNTNKVLYVYSVSDSVMPEGDFRTDPYFEPIPAFAGNGNIKIGEIRFIGGGRPTCVEDIMSTEKQLYIYVFDSAYIAKKDWNEVLNNNLIDKRIDLKIEQLVENNFTLDYNQK